MSSPSQFPAAPAAARHSAPRTPHSALARRCLAGLVCVLSLVTAAPAAVLTLDDAIRLALQRNQALKVSAYSPQIARANLLAAYGSFDPVLRFERTYSESEAAGSLTPLRPPLSQSDDYDLRLTGLTPWGASYQILANASNARGTSNGFTDRYSTFGGVSVTQPLLRGFGFGSTLANLRIAKADKRIADWQHQLAVINTVTNTVLLYNTLVQARENLRIAQLSRSLSAQLLEQNEKKNRVGANSDADVIQSRANVASREENVLIALRSVADLENDLRQLVGETAFPVTGPAIELEPLPPAPPLTVDAAADLKRAYALRPDYLAFRAGVDRRRISAVAAKNQLLPTVNFVGSYGYSGLDRDFGVARRQVRDEDNRAYSAGVVVSLPLTWAGERGRAHAAKLGLRQSEADLVRFEQDIAIDVASAAGQIETTHQRVDAAATAVKLAEQSLNAEQLKFQAGSSTTFLVIQAQDSLALRQNSYARALADERRARVNYEREIGVTLQMRGIKLE